MSGVIYGLCALTAFLCAWLLLSAYYRNRYRPLLWGGVCFVGVTFSNILLVIDKLILPADIDLSVFRNTLTLASLIVFLYGLIWDAE